MRELVALPAIALETDYRPDRYRDSIETQARKCLWILQSNPRKFFRSPFKLAEHAHDCSFLLVQISTFISNGCIRYPPMPKFMQSLGEENYHRLLAEAKARDVTVQALIRTIVVPDWLKASPTGHSNIQNTMAQPTSLLARTGILTEQPRRPFLNTTIGRART